MFAAFCLFECLCLLGWFCGLFSMFCFIWWFEFYNFGLMFYCFVLFEFYFAFAFGLLEFVCFVSALIWCLFALTSCVSASLGLNFRFDFVILLVSFVLLYGFCVCVNVCFSVLFFCVCIVGLFCLLCCVCFVSRFGLLLWYFDFVWITLVWILCLYWWV